MNSTESTGDEIEPVDVEAITDAFFDDRLTPCAEALRGRGVAFFALGPDAGASTYWVDRSDRAAPALETIESPDIVERLIEMWSRQGLTELVDLAAPLLELGEQLKPEDDSDEIPPFIYAMF